MFADAVVDEKLDLFGKSEGWRPKPHSIEEIDIWVTQLATAFEVDAKGGIYQTRSLSKKEARFIANERAMCMASCGYFLTRYYYIKAKSRIIRFTFRQGQWILWKMMQQLDEMGVSKMMQILKARQLGISTVAEGIATWYSLFVPGVASQIGSSDGQKTQIMLGMMTLAIDQLPPWLPPTQTRSKTASDRALLEFSHIGSIIMVQPGSMRGGMGQGTTPTFVHLSEISQFTNPVQQLDEGLFKALHEGPELVVMLESTGDAAHTSAWWWKEQWIANRDNYWSGNAKFLPVFLPWHTTPELYPGPAWLKKFPMPGDFSPNADTVSHITRAVAYVRSTKMLSSILGADWVMPKEQQWYWQFNHEDHKRRRVEKSWYRQMPSDDYEALLGENDKIVGQDTVELMRSTVAEVETTPVYMIAGDGIAEKYEPKDPDIWYGDSAPDRLRCHWMTPRKEKMEWMFVPLLPVKKQLFDPLGKFLMYEEPREGFDYSMGVDTGTGVGGDRTVINVTRYGTGSDADVQVAEYTADHVALDDIYAWICAIATLYSQYMTDKPHPKIAIEMRRKFGDGPYHVARLMGLRRWHEWGQGFDRKTFDAKVGKHGRIGWFTNEWSRPLLLSRFQSAVENGWYVVKSKWLAEEIEKQEQKTTAGGKTRSDHEAGGHDDRIFGAAMAYFTLHQCDVMALRMKKRYDEPTKSKLVIEKGPAMGSPVTLIGESGKKFWLGR